jgi:hypothetical protein
MRKCNIIPQEVKEFCYIGSVITEDGKSTKGIRRRIGSAKEKFKEKTE